jgi:spore maturation protein CgeB
MKLSILFIGSDFGTSRHRALALQRLGHEVSIVDPRRFLPNSYLTEYWIFHTGALFLERLVRERMLANLPSAGFDLVWVDCGALVGPSLVSELKRRYGTIVNYNIDDPYGNRDGGKWRLYLAAVPFYDLISVVRECNVKEAFAAGAKDVLLVSRSADEVAHAKREISMADREKWASEVLFVGTWMPERGPFLAQLTRLGVPLTIYGDRWPKAKEWNVLGSHWRGPGMYIDDDYAKAIQCTKVCLGLLSKGNRDLSTTRSFEIPYLEGILCAERTVEHVALYREDEEAVFWATPEDCANKCIELLNKEEWRQSIARKGRVRCIQNETTNEKILRTILNRSLAVYPDNHPLIETVSNRA